MHVDKPTGVVKSVEILQSTGHAILDRACVDALKRWKFIPDAVTKIKTPVTFSIKASEKT
jgi:TonB family protein